MGMGAGGQGFLFPLLSWQELSKGANNTQKLVGVSSLGPRWSSLTTLTKL